MSASSFRGAALTFTWPQSFRLLSLGMLKNPGYSAQSENEETLHLHNFDACQTICNHPGSFESVRQSMIWRVHACLDSAEDILKSRCELWLDKQQ